MSVIGSLLRLYMSRWLLYRSLLPHYRSLLRLHRSLLLLYVSLLLLCRSINRSLLSPLCTSEHRIVLYCKKANMPRIVGLFFFLTDLFCLFIRMVLYCKKANVPIIVGLF